MDPVAAGQAASFLQASGPWGAITLLIGVVVFLYRRTLALQDKLNEVYELRVKEGVDQSKETTTGLAKASTAMGSLNLLGEETKRGIDRIMDGVTPIAPGVEAALRVLENNAAMMIAANSKLDRLLERSGDRK